ncbi:O-antigen ligase family protein [Flavobacterium sp.]|uniref:O-antigen ligase family protein n=1 Tax=Flavobacterium sp. TaxID=239 RepID=UPI0040470849
MEKSSKNSYLILLFIHAILGGVVYVFPFLAKIFSLIIVIVGYTIVIKNKNKNNEVLIVSAYIIGVEVFLRMTNGMHINEYGKYNVILLMFLGILYKSFHKGSYIYLVYLFLLLPGVLYGIHTLNFDANIRKAIAFNISGPVCLGFSALYCYRRAVSFNQMKAIFIAFGLPIISIVVYLFCYSPNIKSVITSTESNHDTSGGFGPNQMSTILGFGIFVFFSLFYLFLKLKREKIIIIILMVIVAYRGVITFSRGGVYVGIVMIIFLIILTFKHVSIKARLKVLVMIFFGFLLVSAIWTYTSVTTSGLIDKRYANQDVSGKEKKSKLTGREVLIESELLMFYDNPITGVGVGKNKEYREETTGIEAASHNEISRMLAEHGILGVLCLLILLLTPLMCFFFNRQNVFILSFYLFWLLTINHAAMRLAAPAFIYALSLLNMKFLNNHEENTVHR